MKTGVVTAGGSLKGLYNHTGFFLALKELGISVDACIGTSAGAITGGYICSGGTPENLRKIVTNLKAKDYIDKLTIFQHMWYIARKLRGWSGMTKGKALEKLIEEKFPVRFFEEQPIPFYAHIANLSRRIEEAAHKGELAGPIRASATIPFVFQPKQLRPREWFVDGGVFGYNAVDVLARKHPDLDVIIVNDFHLHDTDIDDSFMRKPLTPLKIMDRLIDCVMSKFDDVKYEILDLGHTSIEVISIRPIVPFKVDLQKPDPKLAKVVIDHSIAETKKAFKRLAVVKAEADMSKVTRAISKE